MSGLTLSEVLQVAIAAACERPAFAADVLGLTLTTGAPSHDVEVRRAAVAASEGWTPAEREAAVWWALTEHAYAYHDRAELQFPEPEAVPALNSKLFPWQREVVDWALRQGRAALFEDCGLGKGLQQLEWARCVPGDVLILTPLAVAGQLVREAEKFGIDCSVGISRDGRRAGKVTITNYEQAEKFDPGEFTGVVLDESSILKSYMGRTKRWLLSAFASTPFRLCATATPAPNDHLELGNHAEFLGVMSSHEMIARWFIADQSSVGTYRLKGHAISAFWDWVASWARCVGRPSDLGAYPDDGYRLPPLRAHQHVVELDIVEGRDDGQLFRIPATSATAIHEERRRTAGRRAAAVAELVAAEPDEQWLIWCETDYEADALQAIVPDAVDVRGSQAQALKEARLLGFAAGSVRVLVTKPKIAGFGMNWQSCARVVFVGPTFSFEQYYQAIRRCWRFGQQRPVDLHMVMAPTEIGVHQILQRKAEAHRLMQVEMFAAMRRAQARRSDPIGYEPRHCAPVPEFLWSAA